MAFADAIPVNRVSHSSYDFHNSVRKESGRGWSREAKQSVNISEETVARVARSRLAQALRMKMSYNRYGEFEERLPVGSHLSAKA